MRKKILIIVGTRPEAIKMAPLVKQFANNKEFYITKLCATGQHKEMLDQVLEFFELETAIKSASSLCTTLQNHA